MSSDRPRRVRGLAADLSTRWQVQIRATFDSGPRWYLEWTDGPPVATVHAAIDAADLAGAQIRTYRSRSARAIAVGAVRLAASGEFGVGRRWRQPLSQIEQFVDDVEHPDHTSDEREEYLVERLLAAATTSPQRGPDEYRIADLVAEHGLAWLLDPATPAPRDEHASPVSRPAGATLSPLEVLTARYAEGQAALAWRDRAATMPLRPAVEAALADPDPDPASARAALTLVRQLRMEQERAEAAAVDLARRARLSWDEIGAALGVSKQSAHAWARRRAAGTPSRASA